MQINLIAFHISVSTDTLRLFTQGIETRAGYLHNTVPSRRRAVEFRPLFQQASQNGYI